MGKHVINITTRENIIFCKEATTIILNTSEQVAPIIYVGSYSSVNFTTVYPLES